MNVEQLHDALDHLDEDLIQVVENLRSRKRSYSGVWGICVAACLCLVLAGLLQPYLKRPSSQQNASGGQAYEYEGGDKWLQTDGAEGIATVAYAHVVDAHEGYFTAKLLLACDGLSAGTEVTVKWAGEVAPGDTVRMEVASREENILTANAVERTETP